MTGEGISAPGCRLTEYPIKIDGDTVYVDVDAVAPVGERR
jgi:toluene monooxygenase system ferredoxin subunit